MLSTIFYSLLDLIVITSSEAKSTVQDQTTRPESLDVGGVTALTKMKTAVVAASIRAQPPPLTPVIVSRTAEQMQEFGKAGSPSSVLKGISLQGEIGAFKETLERTLEKKNELNRNQPTVVVSYRGEAEDNQKHSLMSTSYAQHQSEGVATQEYSQQKFQDTKEHVEPYSFIASSFPPSLEKSAAIQVFTGRQPSLMSLHQSQVKQFGHLSQEAAAIQRHYQHPHMTATHESSRGRKSPSVVGQIVHSHRSSPKTSMPVVVESKGKNPFGSSLPSRFLFPATSVYSSVQNTEHIKQSDEHNYLGINDYPSISQQGIILTSTANQNEMFLQHNEPFESYHRSVVGPAGKRPFPYFEPPYPMSASGVGARAYEELLERPGSIPSLRHATVDVPKPVKNLSRDSSSLMGQQPRDRAPFAVEQHQHHLYYGSTVSNRERIDNRALDVRDQIITEKTKEQSTAYENSRQIRHENMKGSRHGREILKLQSGVVVGTPITTVVNDYHARNLHSHIPQYMREKEPSIDDRNVLGGVYHHPSIMHPDENLRPRMPEHAFDDYRKQQIMFEPLHRPGHRGVIEMPHIQSMREASNTYESLPGSIGPSNIAPSGQSSIVPSKGSATYDSHYGISSGLAQKTPAQMSITGAGGYYNDARTFEKDRPQATKGTNFNDVINEELDHLKKTCVISTKRTSTIKSQSKSTRPSSVDSVIHRSFLTERQQQLSSSLSDLRNLTALHLSPNLPISPVSAPYASKKTSFVFRPWEKEEEAEGSFSVKNSSDSNAATQSSKVSQEGLLKLSQQLQTGASGKRTSNDNTYEEPLMSPTIPYTDRAKDTPSKDIHSPDDNGLLLVAANLIENPVPSTMVVDEFDNVKSSAKMSMPLEGTSSSDRLKISPNILSGDQPKSPNDSEATLSAEESEMEMMREGQNEPKQGVKWKELYGQGNTLELDSLCKLSADARNELYNLESGFQGDEQGAKIGRSMLFENKDERVEAALFPKAHEQSDLLADLEVPKKTDRQEQRPKAKCKKKQKSGAKTKKKGPRRSDGAIFQEASTENMAKLPHVPSTLSPENDIRPQGSVSTFLPSNEPKPTIESSRTPGSTPLINVPQVNLYDEATSLIMKGVAISSSEGKGLELSRARDEEHVVSEDGVLHDSQNIADFEETSAAISSIQKDAGESPSAEEDTAEPYLALWAPADGYPCGTQPASNANESDYHQEYNSETHENNVMADEKELGNNFSTHFLKVPHNSDTERDSDNIAIELQTRLTMNLNDFQQADNVVVPTQADGGIFPQDYETTPISPPGSPISPAEVPASHGEMTSSSFSHSVLSLNIAVTSQDSPRVPAVAFPYSTLSFPFSTLSSMPASRSGSLHGSGSSSACHSPSPLANIQNSPCYAASFANAMTRSDFQGEHSDNLRNLTERLLNSDMSISQEDHMTMEVANRTSDSVENFSSTITYEPLSDED